MDKPRVYVPPQIAAEWVERYNAGTSIYRLHGTQTGPVHYTVHMIGLTLRQAGLTIRSHTEQILYETDMRLGKTDALARYVAGESAKSLAAEFKLNATTFQKWVARKGVKVRNRGETVRMRARNMTEEQRYAQVAKAWEAHRDVATPETKAAAAQGRHGKKGENYRPGHDAVVKSLRRGGHKVTIAKAIGPYNVALWSSGVAIELSHTGPWWPVNNRPGRIRVILADGHDLLYVCVASLKFPPGHGTMQLIHQRVEWRQANPDAPPVFLAITRREEYTEPMGAAAFDGASEETKRTARHRSRARNRAAVEAVPADGHPG